MYLVGREGRDRGGRGTAGRGDRVMRGSASQSAADEPRGGEGGGQGSEMMGSSPLPPWTSVVKISFKIVLRLFN